MMIRLGRKHRGMPPTGNYAIRRIEFFLDFKIRDQQNTFEMFDTLHSTESFKVYGSSGCEGF